MYHTRLAWHLVSNKLLGGLDIPADGEWLTHEGPVKMCESGLHASYNLLDALLYKHGPTVCRVECRDIYDTNNTKIVCRHRKILWRIDATETFLAFSRRIALDIKSLWNMPKPVGDYLRSPSPEACADALKALLQLSQSNMGLTEYRAFTIAQNACESEFAPGCSAIIIAHATFHAIRFIPRNHLPKKLHNHNPIRFNNILTKAIHKQHRMEERDHD